MIGLHSDIYKLGMMIKIAMLYILISFWMSLIFIQETKCFGIHFLANISIDLDGIQYIATTCWFVEAYARFILHK